MLGSADLTAKPVSEEPRSLSARSDTETIVDVSMSSKGQNKRPKNRQPQAAPSRRARARQPQRTGGKTIIRAPIPRVQGLQNHHFDAFGNPSPQALAFSVGPATHVAGMARKPITMALDPNRSTLVMYQPGGVNQLIWRVRTGAVWSGSTELDIASTGITTTPGSGSPDTIMCSRGSIRIRNISQAATMAGVVHVLRIGSGVDFALDPAGLETLVRSHSRTVTMGASELSDTHQWDCIPVSQDKYHNFEPVTDGLTLSIDPGISSILLLFDHSAEVDQNYEFSIAATYYARYRMSGPLANMSRPPPTTNLDLINKIRGMAEKFGSVGVPILQNMASEAAGAYARRVPGMLGNLISQSGPLALTL